jgi:hypothetical protein
MSNNLVERQRERLKDLLGGGRVSAELEEIKPPHDPSYLNALDVVSYKVADSDLVFSVFIFDNQAEHAEAIKKLLASTPQTSNNLVRYASNGPMLFFGQTPTQGDDDLDAQFALSEVISAFAGDE